MVIIEGQITRKKSDKDLKIFLKIFKIYKIFLEIFKIFEIFFWDFKIFFIKVTKIFPSYLPLVPA